MRKGINVSQGDRGWHGHEAFRDTNNSDDDDGVLEETGVSPPSCRTLLRRLSVLRQAHDYIDRAYEFIKETVAHGGTILYVGTRSRHRRPSPSRRAGSACHT